MSDANDAASAVVKQAAVRKPAAKVACCVCAWTRRRWSRLMYAGFDQHGSRFERTVEGFHARVVQHECDHLDGLLYPMRVRDFRRFGFIDELFGAQAAAE